MRKLYLSLLALIAGTMSLEAFWSSRWAQRAYAASRQFLQRSFSTLPSLQFSQNNRRTHSGQESWLGKKPYALLGLWGWWAGTTQQEDDYEIQRLQSLLEDVRSLHQKEKIRDFLRDLGYESFLVDPKLQNSTSLKHVKVLGPKILARYLLQQEWFRKFPGNKKDLFSRALLRESEHEVTDYQVFYHAHCGKLRPLHDLYRSLNDLLSSENTDNSHTIISTDSGTDITINPIHDLYNWGYNAWYQSEKSPPPQTINRDNEFIYLRDPINPVIQVKNQPTDVSYAREWRKRVLRTEESDTDSFESSATRLSVNVSLFGNVLKWHFGESSLHYFMTNTSMQNDIESLILRFLNNYDLRLKNHKNIFGIVREKGHLLQIFIPKNQLGKCSYVSYPRGIPVCRGSETCMTYRDLMACLKITHHKTGWDKEEAGVFPQMRLILHPDIMLNPKSGVKIFRYTSMLPEVDQAYQHAFKEVTRIMFIEWFERMQQGNVKQEALERICHTKLGQKILRRDPISKQLIPQCKAIDAELHRLRQKNLQ